MVTHYYNYNSLFRKVQTLTVWLKSQRRISLLQLFIWGCLVLGSNLVDVTSHSAMVTIEIDQLTVSPVPVCDPLLVPRSQQTVLLLHAEHWTNQR